MRDQDLHLGKTDQEKNTDNTPITYEEIARALAEDYVSLFVIDSEDDSYVEYLTEGEPKRLVQRASGVDFYRDVIHDAKKQVYPEDQSFFIESFKKEKVIDILKTGISFSLNYRLLVDGEVLHYFLKTIRGMDQKVIIGVRNVEEQWKREHKAEEEAIIYRQIAGALASRYEVIYIIDIEDNHYTQYSASEEYAKLGTTRSGEDFFSDAAEDIKKYIHKDDVKRVLSEMRKDRLLANLEESGSLAFTYRQVLGERTVYVSMNVVRPKNDPMHIVMGVMNVDAQVRREQSILEESRTFDEIAMALATRYEVIYHVNIRTNEYAEYSASEKYTRLKVGSRGKDFFIETHGNMQHDIYPDDLPMMNMAMEKTYLLKSLEESGKIFLNYRLILDGRPQFVTLFAVRPKEDSDHIIVAVANVDAAKRKEIEVEKSLGLAMDMANKDALTGVKNKLAYANAETEIDEQLSEKEILDAKTFSVVVCDINGLKIVNDSLGHSAGDNYICDASEIICNIYKHSPVFRIGGDEFVVLLRGVDYDNRMDLYAELARKQRENRKAGKVTIAYGMADFDPWRDNRLQDVFERADRRMYDNKRAFKENSEKEDFLIGTENMDSDLVEGDFPEYPEKRKQGLDKLHQAFSIMAEGNYVYLCDLRYDISKWSKNAVFIFGLPGEYMYKAGSIWQQHIHPDDVEIYHAEIDKLFNGSTDGHDMQYRARKADGEYVICTCRGIVLYDENGVPDYFAGSIWNHSIQENVDKLTGLSNQYGFLETVQENLAQKKEMEITLVGIGRFAEFNEVYGYHFGNKILQRFARYLYDFVGDTGTVFRLDGTKFVVIGQSYKADKIRQEYEKLRFYCRTQFKVEGKNIILDLNSGHISVKNFDIDSQTVYACLSFVYSESKLHKQGDMVEFLNNLNNENSERIEKLHVIRGSIMKEYEGFYLLYQPVVDSKTEKLIGGEALIRWKNDRYGTVRPDHFIPLLEKDPLFPELGKWILRTALIDAKKIMKLRPEFVVNVNLSYTQLEKGGFVDMVLQTLKEQEFPPDHLCLEITERCRLLDMEILKNVIVTLRSYGVKIALDDFGTGFSSIGLVKNLPFDTIKIDRSFVLRIEEDEKEKRLVENFVNVAATFGAKVCIEGIETAGMKEILQKYRVQSFQGYYYAKPIPVEDLERVLTDKNSGFKNIG